MKKIIKILILLLIPFTASSQIEDYPWYWQSHLAPVFLVDSTDMLGKVKFGENGVYFDSVKYANDTLYFYTDSTANPFKMPLNPGSGSSVSGDSTWALATVTEGLILPTGDTLKGMYPLNDSTMVIVNSDTTCMSGCSESTGGNPILSAVTVSDTARWGLQSNYDTIGIVTDVDLTGGSTTQVNTGQSASIPKVISIQDTVYNEYEDAFDIQYRLSTTWYIDIYSTSAYDSLTIYYIKDDAGGGSGGVSRTELGDTASAIRADITSGGGSGNVISSVVQNLSTQVDNGVFYKDPVDSLRTSINFTYTDSTTNILNSNDGGNKYVEFKMNSYKYDNSYLQLNLVSSLFVQSLYHFTSDSFKIRIGTLSNDFNYNFKNESFSIYTNSHDSIARFSDGSIKFFRDLYVTENLYTGSPKFYAACSDSSVTIDITQDVYTHITNTGNDLLTEYRNRGGFTFQGDSVQIPLNGWYIVEYVLDFQGTATGSIFHGEFMVNGTLVENRGTFVRSTSTNALTGSTKMKMDYQFTAGDWVKAMITNNSNNTDATIISSDFFIKWDE